MKIKRKKQLNLPQLIEYAWENDVRDSKFQTVKDGRGVFYEVYFSEDGSFYSNDELDYNDIFTVKIEETVTEDTVIPKMLVIGRFDGYEEVSNRKISHFNQHLLSAYLIDDDGRMELLYDEEKGLVE